MDNGLESIFARPLQADDSEPLKLIDETYTKFFSLESKLTKGSLNFYIRTGHAFTAVRKSEIVGFILAQAVWNGNRPIVFINHMAVADIKDLAARLAMLEAVTKSAYDAAVYDIQVQIPTKDIVAIQSLAEKQYDKRDLSIYERILGSRNVKVV